MHLISDVNCFFVTDKLLMNFPLFRGVKICDFDWLFSFHSYVLNFSSSFTKMVTIES